MLHGVREPNKVVMNVADVLPGRAPDHGARAHEFRGLDPVHERKQMVAEQRRCLRAQARPQQQRRRW
jgi:hypothetical protein